MSLLRKARKAFRARPAVSTDDVIPVRYWDYGYANGIMHFMLRFDRKLDADKLRSSLERLLARQDGWRKFGGSTTASDVVLPRVARHAAHAAPAGGAHPQAKPARTHGPRVVARVEDFLPLMRRPADPAEVDDYVDTDTPVLGLHLVTFRDATLVTLRGSHILFDGMGRKELLDAWSLTLQGRDDEVASPMECDPMASLGAPTLETAGRDTSSPGEEYQLADKRLGTRHEIILALRQVFDSIRLRTPVEEDRVVCVPEAYVDMLRKDALANLEPREMDDNHKGVSNSPRFVSDGDVLCAWWSRHVISSLLRAARTSSQTVCITNWMGLRGLLKQQAGLIPALEKRNALVANALVPVPALIASKELLGRPLGDIAAMLRQALQTLGTWPQVQALMRLQRGVNDKMGGVGPPIFGDAGMHMLICSNLTKAGFYDIDFSAAVAADDGDDQVAGPTPVSSSSATARLGRDRTKPAATATSPLEANHGLMGMATPTSVQAHLITKHMPSHLISPFSIMGKDAHGNYWIKGTLREEHWPKVEQSLLEEALIDRPEAS
ncbi:uncharacterized protein PG998_009002 [Apiospora kogelbergensis]|uniref:uncharacterized protein n=1 Tax=Apiospora kogelbergensis TaxID=1337665 RepID=UPI003131857C